MSGGRTTQSWPFGKWILTGLTVGAASTATGPIAVEGGYGCGSEACTTGDGGTAEGSFPFDSSNGEDALEDTGIGSEPGLDSALVDVVGTDSNAADVASDAKPSVDVTPPKDGPAKADAPADAPGGS